MKIIAIVTHPTKIWQILSRVGWPTEKLVSNFKNSLYLTASQYQKFIKFKPCIRFSPGEKTLYMA